MTVPRDAGSDKTSRFRVMRPNCAYISWPHAIDMRRNRLRPILLFFFLLQLRGLERVPARNHDRGVWSRIRRQQQPPDAQRRPEIKTAMIENKSRA